MCKKLLIIVFVLFNMFSGIALANQPNQQQGKEKKEVTTTIIGKTGQETTIIDMYDTTHYFEGNVEVPYTTKVNDSHLLTLKWELVGTRISEETCCHNYIR